VRFVLIFFKEMQIVSLLNCLRDCSKVLSEQGERDIAYLHGYFPEVYLPGCLSRQKYKWLKKYLWVQLVLLVKSCISPRSRYRFIGSEKGCLAGSSSFLFFAGTQNQLNSLAPTFNSLSGRQEAYFVGSRQLNYTSLTDKNSFTSFNFPWWHGLACLCLSFSSLPRLLAIIQDNDIKLYHPYCISVFSRVYISLVDSWCMLIDRPRFLVVSNDHNPINRALTLLALKLGVKSIYMQHASVSERFPPLRFNYAFLDGEKALSRMTHFNALASTLHQDA
jgi:hypothetical protein